MFAVAPAVAPEPVALIAAAPAEQRVAALAVLAAPRVTNTSPANGATGVRVDTAVTADVYLPNGGIDGTTLTSRNVYLFRTSDGLAIPAVLNTSGGGDVIVLKPKSPLAPKTNYTFVVTPGLRDVKGVGFTEARRTFTTGAALAGSGLGASFQKVALPNAQGSDFFSLAVGPDSKLYAGTSDGRILRFPIKGDGTLGTAQVIDTIRRVNGGARFVVGLAFDPAATASNPVLWVSHSATSDLNVGGRAGADWTGKITRLSGANLATAKDAVIHLPRSVRDHVTDQLAFGPDKALYFCQPSNSAMGAPDATWGKRPEHLLNATILRLDLAKLGGATLDAHTEDATPYNPFAPGAPLTIYAQGVRNAFDLVWHSNGSLYAPANGSAAGGNTPAGPGVPGLTNVSKSESDFLFRIQRGGYYGHPNPRQGHFVLNGGNPTAGADRFEVTDYPVGTKPDPNWRPAVFDFGQHQSPDGAIEYRGPAFNGALDHKILVCRYSGGDDIVALNVGADGNITRQYTGIPGLTGLNNPVDVVEHLPSGNLYVSELGARKITLLRPVTVAPASAPRALAIASPSEEVEGWAEGTGGLPADGTTPDVYAGDFEPDPEWEFPAELPDAAPAAGAESDAPIIWPDEAGTDCFPEVSGGDTSQDSDTAATPESHPGTGDSPEQEAPVGSTDTSAPAEMIPAPARSAGELKLIRKVEAFAAKNRLPAPDLANVPRAALKDAFRELKARATLIRKVTRVAARKNRPVPDLHASPVADLKALLSSLEHEEVPS